MSTKKSTKKSAARIYTIIVRWTGKQENLTFPDGWATLNTNGWSAGLHFDKDSLFSEGEIEDRVDEFIEDWIAGGGKPFRGKSPWEFRLVAPL